MITHGSCAPAEEVANEESGQGVGQQVGLDQDANTAEAEMAINEEEAQEELQPVKVLKSPLQPSQQEVDEHEASGHVV